MGRPRREDERKYIQVGLDPTEAEMWRRTCAIVRAETDMPDASEADILRKLIREGARARGVEPPRPPAPTPPPGSYTPPAGTVPSGLMPSGLMPARLPRDVDTPPEGTPRPHSPPASTLPSGRHPPPSSKRKR